MKTTLFVTALALASLASVGAYADGFTCESRSENLRVQVKNHVHAPLGTRQSAILIVSDPTARFGDRTLLTSKNIQQNGADYTAITEGGDSETHVLSLFAAQVAKVELKIKDFNFNNRDKDGTEYGAELRVYADETRPGFVDATYLTCIYNTKN